MDVLISSNDFVNIFDNIIENSNDFLHTEIKRTMIDGIFCECEKYYAGINNILHLFQTEKIGDNIRLFYKSNELECLEVNVYFKNNKIHRDDDLPSLEISYFKYDMIVTWNTFNVWFKYGKTYRQYGQSIDFSSYIICLHDELALIQDTPDAFLINEKKDIKNKSVKIWKDGDKLHRINGAAIIKTHKNFIEYEYYLNGLRFDKSEYKYMLICYKWIKKLRKRVLCNVLYRTKPLKICKDISDMVSNYIY